MTAAPRYCLLFSLDILVSAFISTLLCSWNFPGKNTGVGCHFLLQGIFLTQRWDLGLVSPVLVGEFFTTALPGTPSTICLVPRTIPNRPNFQRGPHSFVSIDWVVSLPGTWRKTCSYPKCSIAGKSPNGK